MTSYTKWLSHLFNFLLFWVTLYVVLYSKNIYKTKYVFHLEEDKPYAQAPDKPLDTCEIPPYDPILSEVKDGQVSKKVCVNRIDLKPDFDKLMFYLRVSAAAKGQDFLVAANHGVFTRAGYLTDGDLGMYNPVFKSGKHPGYAYQITEKGDLVKREGRFDEIEIEYVDEKWQHQTRVFRGKPSASVQTMLNLFRGEIFD
jgi:hypothetical protein